jgi:hypothetical protein
MLDDFVLDWTSPNSGSGDDEMISICEIRCERAWSLKGAKIAAIITSSTGVKLRNTTRL